MKYVILQLKTIPQQSDIISGTINGVSVNGVWGDYIQERVELVANNSSNQYDYVIQCYQDKYVFFSYEAENDRDGTYVPTDLSINLSLTRMPKPVRIPAEYLDTDNIENSISNINNNIKNIKMPPASIVSKEAPTKSTEGVNGQSYYKVNTYSDIESSYIYYGGWLQECESRSYTEEPQINHTVSEEDDRSNITFYKDDNNIDLRHYRRMFIKIQSPDTLSSDDDSNIKIIVDLITISSKNDFLTSQNKNWYCYVNYVDKFAIATKDAYSLSDEIDGVEATLAFP